MKFRVYKTPTFKYHFIFQKQFSADRKLISLGHDCHPAYMLQFLNIRKKSLVFDWIYTEPVDALNYVCQNIKNEFSDFLDDLAVNEDKKIYSENYPSSLFFHSNDLIDNPETYATYQRRAKRFLQSIRSGNCTFLHSLTALAIQSRDDVEKIKASVIAFQSLMKPTDELLIYLKYDECLDENKRWCEMLINEVSGLDQVKISQFNRQVTKYGIWGNKKKFIPLLEEFGVKIKRELPLITIKKSLIDRQ